MGQLKRVFVNVTQTGNAQDFLDLRLNDADGPSAEVVTLGISEDGAEADQVEWICNDGSMQILFDPAGTPVGDPFGDPMGRYEKPAGLPIDPPRPVNEAAGVHVAFNGFNGQVQRVSYKYQIIVTTDQGQVVIKDPYVIVARPRPIVGY
jgi:hypothetical protein